MAKSKPCPFCGGELKLLVMDDEFNVRNEEYESDPWSGLQFALYHPESENKGCPIATEDEEHLGVFGYRTRKDATAAWNRRA